MVVDVPKDQQIGGGALLRERALRGAFANLGPLDQGDQGPDQHAAANDREAAYSAPIKAELIGSPQDVQLKAALAHLGGEAVQAKPSP